MVKNLLFLINLLHKWLKLLNRSLNGSQMVAFTFAMLILCGSLLLMLPMASADGSSMRFIDALFTATSTCCCRYRALFFLVWKISDDRSHPDRWIGHYDSDHLTERGGW